ncbi:MAG: zf-HC2 domain-containing protein [Myxococcales bacterium]|nr:zf-HC2 domain-containing protein [Myxococcales bacterium]
MKCEEATDALVAFALGPIEGDARDALEAHLAECPECLRAYFALKRAIDEPDARAPSETSRAKLRASVAKELRRDAPSWRWWERPVAAAIAAASVLFALRAVQALSASEGRAPHALSDR